VEASGSSETSVITFQTARHCRQYFVFSDEFIIMTFLMLCFDATEIHTYVPYSQRRRVTIELMYVLVRPFYANLSKMSEYCEARWDI
jgi:hypothetical protein